ncbi:S8 family serine peptidase [Robertmurraya beringensis]|uniref:S8 family serine peptidase n=1 Tax=Robertmurraya beringensis TaxID=641660 RepID=A0ABV6KQE5_9BACI
MKIWKKSISIVAGIGLLANGFIPLSTAAAESKFSSLQEVAAVTANQPQLQAKINTTDEKVVSEDTLVIKMNKLLTSAQHKAAGATLLKQFSDLKYAVVKVTNKKDLNKVIRNYQKLNEVKSVSPSVFYKPLGIDPKASSQYQNSLLQLEKAQKLAGKNAVTVAVIDQGVDSKHPDLKGRLLSSYNTVNPMNPGSPDYHGTHVSGIIAANKGNGIGGYGVNPNAKILPIDVFDRGWGASDYAIANGILYAVEKGAKVINMSLGGSMKSPLIEEALQKAAEKNVVVIAAAGNTGDDTISYPAAYEGVISVGSVNSDKKLSYFSSYGPSVDVVAPGEDIYSTMYDYEKKSTFVKMSGTSMATPMVSGIASLLLSKNPNLTPAQIEYILEETAEDLGAIGFDVKYANGLVNPVLAMQYDVKKLPTLLTKKLTVEEMIVKAAPVKLTEPVELEGQITMPYQEYLYKVDVEKGDNLQFVLDGASQFDYKLSLYLETKDGKHSEEINAVQEGKQEGKLFQAPFSGTLVFSVKDVNGSYDKSALKSSEFTLNVSKQIELPADHSDLLKPLDSSDR